MRNAIEQSLGSCEHDGGHADGRIGVIRTSGV